MQPEQILLEHQALIGRLARRGCRRYRLGADHAEEFASIVNLKLIENDYRVLRTFEGRSKITTFLTVVVQRCLHDYVISLWGKWRPSARARQLGPLAVRLEELMVKEGHTFPAAAEILLTNEKAETTLSELEELAGRLPVRYRRRTEPEDTLDERPAEEESAEARLERSQNQATWDRVLALLDEVLSQMPGEDATIVRMLAEFKVSQIARCLDLEPKPLYRRLNKLKEQVQQELGARGVGASQIRDLLRWELE